MGQNKGRTISDDAMHVISTIEESGKASSDAGNSPFGVGYSFGFYGNGYKQSSVGRETVFSYNSNYIQSLYKRIKKMANAKITLILFHLIGFPIYFYDIISEWGSIQSIILSAIGVLYSIAWLVFYIKRQMRVDKKEKQIAKLRSLKIDEVEFELNKKIHKFDDE
jgi:hypothetical protein